MAATESNNVTFVELLLKRPDFTVNQLTPEGDTPLSYAKKIGAADDTQDFIRKPQPPEYVTTHL